LPETYIPWDEEPDDNDIFLPEQLTSLQGLEVYHTLTDKQKLELGRHEIVQVLYSYAWGEGLFCVFMNKYILNRSPEDPEYRFLMREIIEEFRHQEMFTQVILKLGGKPIKITPVHRFLSNFSTNYLPADCLFMGSLAIEMITDMYGDHGKRETRIFNVLRKVFELHSIEEGRHIHFTKGLLKQYTSKAGVIKRTVYSFIVLFNIYFLRTLYVKKEIYERIGITDVDKVYKDALKNYQVKFTEYCLDTVVEFVSSWGGFNSATRWAWRVFLNVKA
jgi:hypothetical protein